MIRKHPAMKTMLLAMAAVAAMAGARSSHAALIDPELQRRLERLTEGESVEAIIQLREGLTTADLKSLDLSRRLKREYRRLGMVCVALQASSVEGLAADPRIKAISIDRRVEAAALQPASLIQQVTGSDVAASQYAVTGQGIGIAVLDSGVYPHVDVPVATSVNFAATSGTASDLYGHGTHVAGVALGSGAGSRADQRNYAGIAPRATLLNVKVLDDMGRGQVSWTLAGIDWVLQNRVRYNIRVVNLSLGTPATLSYTSDPLCQATKILHDAGIVTVAAAGNYGKAPSGSVAFGSISSPGISPWVITVGAANDQGTALRSDDSVATYSSRGPTRSYDPVTVRFDNLVKPDLVATGNHIVGPQAAGNWIVSNYPSFHLSTLDHGSYMYLNGTSMAAPIVSGTVALMLQANPALAPSHVKAILMYSATTLPGFSVYDQGAGEVNAEGAVRMAVALKKAPLKEGPGKVLLAPNKMPAPSSALAGQSVPWSKGTILIMKNSGSSLVQAGGVLFAEGVIFAEAMISVRGIAFSEGTVTSEGVIFAERSVLETSRVLAAGKTPARTSTGLLDASRAMFSEAGTLGNGTFSGTGGAVQADSVLFAEGVIFAERGSSPSRLTFVRASTLSAEQEFSQGMLMDARDLAVLFTNVNNVLVAGEAFLYY